MTTHPIPSNEKERLEELFSYHILDTPAEEEFESIVNIVTKTFDVPFAAISFIDSRRQWVKSNVGYQCCDINRSESVCSYTIMQNSVLEVEDLQADVRFNRFPGIVNSPFYRFYAGVPLVTKRGFNIGALCIVDNRSRKLTKEDHLVMLSFARNIINQLELRLENLSLQQQNDTQKRISAALSHDVRGPLANVKMILDMQEEETEALGNDDDREVNKMLRQGVENTMDILNNMIQWGKLQLSGDATATRFNLRELVDKSLNEVYDSSSAKFNTLVNAVPGEVIITAEYEGIRFVLRNLLTNAGKFTHNGCITVSYEITGSRGMLMVRDTGTGMSPETTARLNRSQKIAHTNGTHNEKGNGLGLSLVQEYLARFDKELFFQSMLGIGTIASFEV